MRDGGSTWNDTLIFPGSDPFDYADCRHFYFIDALRGYLTANKRSGGGLIMKTSDGGKSWNELMTTSGSLRSFTMLDTSHGWIGGENGLFYILTDKTVSLHRNKSIVKQPETRQPPIASAVYLLNGRRVHPASAANRRQCHIVTGNDGQFLTHIALRNRVNGMP